VVDDIRFHPEAQAEYEGGLAWYQARSPQAAMRFEAEVERVLGLVAANPSIFPKYDDENRFIMLRRFPFSVVYQVQPDHVYVMALAHSRRSAGYWRGRA
jgi:plasmid stabilization system protein ParE